MQSLSKLAPLLALTKAKYLVFSEIFFLFYFFSFFFTLQILFPFWSTLRLFHILYLLPIPLSPLGCPSTPTKALNFLVPQSLEGFVHLLWVKPDPAASCLGDLIGCAGLFQSSCICWGFVMNYKVDCGGGTVRHWEEGVLFCFRWNVL